MGNIIQAKVDLTGIAAMALGSGLTEGRSGGEGHIGMIGNRAVKFNTHGNEYSKNSLNTLERNNPVLFSQMKQSSDALRAKLREIGNSIKEVGNGDYEKLTAVLNEVLDADNANWSDKGLLRRKAVAKAVTEINKFLGDSANEEVWGSVENIKKSLQTRDIGDTRALFAASREHADAAMPQMEALKTNAAAALKVGTKRCVSQEVVEAGQVAIDNYQKTNNSFFGRPDFRANRGPDGKPVMVDRSMENQAAEFDGYGFDSGDFVSKGDLSKYLLFNRLCAINEGVKAMVKTAHESFPGGELDKFFGYGDGKVFDDIVNGLDRQSVRIGSGTRFGVDAKNYGAALRKLQDHFVKVASRLGAEASAIGNENGKAVAQATAHELSMRIVAFLKRQAENTGGGEIKTLREVNPNVEFEYHGYRYVKVRSHDESNDQDDWNRQMTVKLNDGDTDFWVSDIVGTRKVEAPSLKKTLLDPEKLKSRVALPNQPASVQRARSSSIPDLLKSCSPERLDGSCRAFLNGIVEGLKRRVSSTVAGECKEIRKKTIKDGLTALESEKQKLEKEIREELTKEIVNKFEQNEAKRLREEFSAEIKDKQNKNEVNARDVDEKIKGILETRIEEGLENPQSGVERRLEKLLEEPLRKIYDDVDKAVARKKSEEYHRVIPGAFNQILTELGINGISFKMADGDDLTGEFVFTDQNTTRAEMEKLVRAFTENPDATGQKFGVDVEMEVKPALEQLRNALQEFDDEHFTKVEIPDDLHEYGSAPSGESNVADEYRLLVLQKCSGLSRAEATRLVLNHFSRTSKALHNAIGGNQHVIGLYKRILEETVEFSEDQKMELPDFSDSIDNYFSFQNVPLDRQKDMDGEIRSLCSDLKHALGAIDQVYGKGNTYQRVVYALPEEHKVFLGQLSDAIKKASDNGSPDAKVMLKWDDASGWKIVAENKPSENEADAGARNLKEFLQFIADSIDPAVLSSKVRQHLREGVAADTLQKIYDEFAAMNVL